MKLLNIVNSKKCTRENLKKLNSNCFKCNSCCYVRSLRNRRAEFRTFMLFFFASRVKSIFRLILVFRRTVRGLKNIELSWTYKCTEGHSFKQIVSSRVYFESNKLDFDPANNFWWQSAVQTKVQIMSVNGEGTDEIENRIKLRTNRHLPGKTKCCTY